MKSLLNALGSTLGCVVIALLSVVGMSWVVGAQAAFLFMWWRHTDWVSQALPGLTPLVALFVAPTAASMYVWIVGHHIPFEGSWRTWTIVALVINVGSLVGGIVYKMAKRLDLRRGEPAATGMVYAGFFRRLWAAFLDFWCMQVIVGLPVLFVIWAVSMNSDGTAAQCLLWVSLAAYFALLPALFGGTPGKRMLGLKIVTADGQPLSLGRSLGRLGACVVIPLTLGIGFLMVLWDDERRSLPDRIARTRVIRDQPNSSAKLAAEID